MIDDLGVEQIDKAGSMYAKLDTLIDVRYANRRRTIITTNVPPAKLASVYGERIVDRLREGGKVVVVTGPSMRRK